MSWRHGTYIVVSRHIHSSIKAHIQQYEDTCSSTWRTLTRCAHTTTCVLSLLCVLILIELCVLRLQYVSSYYSICVYFSILIFFLCYYYANIILYACFEGGCRSSVRTMNFSKILLKYEKNLRWGTTRHTSTYVPSYSYYYICVLVLLRVSSYY